MDGTGATVISMGVADIFTGTDMDGVEAIILERSFSLMMVASNGMGIRGSLLTAINPVV